MNRFSKGQGCKIYVSEVCFWFKILGEVVVRGLFRNQSKIYYGVFCKNNGKCLTIESGSKLVSGYCYRRTGCDTVVCSMTLSNFRKRIVHGTIFTI